MASVTHAELWINDAVYLDDYRSFRYSTFSDTASSPAEVRRYAGGVTRVIRRVGADRTMTATLLRVGRAERDWLVDHAGRVVVVRDGLGRRMHAVYTSVGLDDIPGVGYSSASVQFQRVAYGDEPIVAARASTAADFFSDTF